MNALDITKHHNLDHFNKALAGEFGSNQQLIAQSLLRAKQSKYQSPINVKINRLKSEY